MKNIPTWIKFLIFGFLAFFVLLGPSKEICISRCFIGGVNPPALEVSSAQNSKDFRLTLWGTETKKRFLNFHLFNETHPFKLYIVGEPNSNKDIQSFKINNMVLTSLSTNEEIDVNLETKRSLTLNDGKIIIDQNALYFPADNYSFSLDANYCTIDTCNPYKINGTIHINIKIHYGFWWWWVASGI